MGPLSNFQRHVPTKTNLEYPQQPSGRTPDRLLLKLVLSESSPLLPYLTYTDHGYLRCPQQGSHYMVFSHGPLDLRIFNFVKIIGSIWKLYGPELPERTKHVSFNIFKLKMIMTLVQALAHTPVPNYEMPYVLYCADHFDQWFITKREAVDVTTVII